MSCGAAANLVRRLEDKIAIITGGASGIGAASARLFSNHGDKVIIADIADEKGHKLAESLSPHTTFIQCNVSNEQDVSAVVDLAMEKHGRLDIMFNNAGVTDRQTGTVADYGMDQFDKAMNVNARGAMHGIKHAARVMIPNRKGSIINTSSVSGMVGGMEPYGYTVSKHAIIGVTKNGAAELGKYGIRVNCISPAALATELVMNYLGKDSSEEEISKVDAVAHSIANLKGTVLKAEDVAYAALYLASEESKYVSGHNLVVDGGIAVVNHNWGLYK
ncbi:hypothetical protein SUGI_0672960 [Cryptomeria japonica]|nr:hypothetical protein SUGI_0672960 [Cryptomeria japonica]